MSATTSVLHRVREIRVCSTNRASRKCRCTSSLHRAREYGAVPNCVFVYGVEPQCDNGVPCRPRQRVTVWRRFFVATGTRHYNHAL